VTRNVSINAKPTTMAKNDKILDLISRKSQLSFEIFKEALRTTGQEHVLLTLLGREVSCKADLDFEGNVCDMEKKDIETLVKEELMKTREAERDGFPSDVSRLLAENDISLSYVGDGCIAIRFRCFGLNSLSKLRELYVTDKLVTLFMNTCCPSYADRGLLSIRLRIKTSEFDSSEEIFRREALMTPEHCEMLKSAMEVVQDKIKVDHDFLEGLSLCKTRKRTILASEDNRQRVRCLLDILSRRPDRAFGEFVRALDETGQSEAANLLTGRIAHQEALQDASNETLNRNKDTSYTGLIDTAENKLATMMYVNRRPKD